MSNPTFKTCTVCGTIHQGIHSPVKCEDCCFKESAYWKRQTRKEKILSIVIYTASAIIAGIGLFPLFQLFFRS